MDLAHVWTDSVEEDVLIAMMDSSDILIALIVHANKTALKITPTFVIEKMENVLANPTLLAEPVMRVRMDTLIILVVKIVDALQIVPKIHLMFVIEKMANAPALENMVVESVINVGIIITCLQRTSNTAKLATNILIYAMEKKEIVLAMMDSSNQKTANIAILLMLILISFLMVNARVRFTSGLFSTSVPKGL